MGMFEINVDTFEAVFATALSKTLCSSDVIPGLTRNPETLTGHWIPAGVYPDLSGQE
jgi:hypothetical protein